MLEHLIMYGLSVHIGIERLFRTTEPDEHVPLYYVYPRSVALENTVCEIMGSDRHNFVPKVASILEKPFVDSHYFREQTMRR